MHVASCRCTNFARSSRYFGLRKKVGCGIFTYPHSFLQTLPLVYAFFSLATTLKMGKPSSIKRCSCSVITFSKKLAFLRSRQTSSV